VACPRFAPFARRRAGVCRRCFMATSDRSSGFGPRRRAPSREGIRLCPSGLADDGATLAERPTVVVDMSSTNGAWRAGGGAAKRRIGFRFESFGARGPETCGTHRDDGGRVRVATRSSRGSERHHGSYSLRAAAASKWPGVAHGCERCRLPVWVRACAMGELHRERRAIGPRPFGPPAPS